MFSRYIVAIGRGLDGDSRRFGLGRGVKVTLTCSFGFQVLTLSDCEVLILLIGEVYPVY